MQIFNLIHENGIFVRQCDFRTINFKGQIYCFIYLMLLKIMRKIVRSLYV